MALVFDPDDEERFSEARGSLLQRFDFWLRDERRLPEQEAVWTAEDAGIALDWKWSYSDGDLLRWGTEDVGEFLLGWCPRKLSIPQEESASIPRSLAAFAAFLGKERLLAPGSSTVVQLVDATETAIGPFVAAMSDPANFGLAKSLFRAASADGVDLADPAQMEGWIAEYNAGSLDDRRRIVPDSALARPSRPSLPPVVVPDEAEVAASKAEAPILPMFAAFAEFVGAGRKLTQTGNLTLADARQLVELLGTGDVIDMAIGDRTFKTRSAGELGRLRQVFAWARKAGVVRVAHGKVIATKAGLALPRDPAAFFDRAADALLALGALASQREADGWYAWPEVTDLLDEFTPHLLAGPYATQGPMPIEEMTDVASELVLDTFHFTDLSDDLVARRVAGDIVDVVDALELAGIVRRADVREPGEADRVVSRRREGGSVELTAAGVSTVRRLLADIGYDTPAAGSLADLAAKEMLLGVDLDDVAVLWGEVTAWRLRRDPAQAASELAAAVLELDDPALRKIALAVMADLDVDVAGPEVRKLLDEPSVRGDAMCWLVDKGLEPEEALFDPDDVSWFVDVLVHRLVVDGPDALDDTLALAGDHDAQVEVIGELWRSPSPATEPVLAAIGEVHPAKVVAKAARKAVFQRRSWLAQV